jgi:hypothetical protein
LAGAVGRWTSGLAVGAGEVAGVADGGADGPEDVAGADWPPVGEGFAAAGGGVACGAGAIAWGTGFANLSGDFPPQEASRITPAQPARQENPLDVRAGSRSKPLERLVKIGLRDIRSMIPVLTRVPAEKTACWSLGHSLLAVDRKAPGLGGAGRALAGLCAVYIVISTKSTISYTPAFTLAGNGAIGSTPQILGHAWSIFRKETGQGPVAQSESRKSGLTNRQPFSGLSPARRADPQNFTH